MYENIPQQKTSNIGPSAKSQAVHLTKTAGGKGGTPTT
jgi:hypothetical protein